MSLSHLARLAGRMQLLVWIGITLLGLIPVTVWFDPDLTVRWGQLTVTWTVADRLIALALTLPPYVMAALGLAQLLHFCRAAQQDRVFTISAARSLRRFGWALIAAALLLPVSRVSVWFFIGFETLATAPGWGRINIGQIALSSGIGLVLGLVLLAFGSILHEATRLAEENASFF